MMIALWRLSGMRARVCMEVLWRFSERHMPSLWKCSQSSSWSKDTNLKAEKLMDLESVFQMAVSYLCMSKSARCSEMNLRPRGSSSLIMYSPTWPHSVCICHIASLWTTFQKKHPSFTRSISKSWTRKLSETGWPEQKMHAQAASHGVFALPSIPS